MTVGCVCIKDQEVRSHPVTKVGGILVSPGNMNLRSDWKLQLPGAQGKTVTQVLCGKPRTGIQTE